MTSSLEISGPALRNALLAGVLGVALAGCGVGEAKLEHAEPAAAAPLPVIAVSSQLSDLFATYHATSTIAADGEAQVPARVGGEVVELLVEEGDRVVQGQVLARLDGARLRLTMLATKAEFARQQNEFERTRKLHERGLVSSAAFESLQFEVESLRAAHELDRLNHEYATIRAPITGVVSVRSIKVGQHVQPGDVTFRITDTSRLVAEFDVPQTELARFRAGLPVAFRVDAAPGNEFQAEIARISPTIDRETGTFGVTSYIDNHDGVLAPGMFARVSVRYEKHAQVVSIPSEAVVDEDGRQVVYVIAEGTAERRPVTTGIADRGRVEIVAGIDVGETVIASGAGGLREGTRVVAMAATGSSSGD